MKIWTPFILVIMAAEQSRVRLLAHPGEQRGGGFRSPCGVEHRQQHFVLFAEVQQQDGGRHCSETLVGERLVASGAVHDPLSCRLDLPSGEMLDLR